MGLSTFVAIAMPTPILPEHDDGADAARRAEAEIDRATLLRCRAQDRIAFRAFVVRYQRAVFACLSRMLGRGPHVEDLAQEGRVTGPDGATWGASGPVVDCPILALGCVAPCRAGRPARC